jgi:hypothetical protein
MNVKKGDKLLYVTVENGNVKTEEVTVESTRVDTESWDGDIDIKLSNGKYMILGDNACTTNKDTIVNSFVGGIHDFLSKSEKDCKEGMEWYFNNRLASIKKEQDILNKEERDILNAKQTFLGQSCFAYPSNDFINSAL